MSRRRTATLLALAALAAGLAFPTGARASDPTPRGVHIAYGADPAREMTVVWHTAGVQDSGTVVQYGPTPALGAVATGVAKPTPGLPPSLTSTLHEVALRELEPGATVWYRAGDGTTWSPTRAFRTAREDATFSFVAFGDHGTSQAAQDTTAFARALDPDFAAIAGDVSYANSRLERWDDYAELVEPLAAEIPLMAAPGNHDTDPGETPTPRGFTERFAYPGEELFYSFSYGRAHFLFLHSTAARGEALPYTARQFAFAEEDLAAAASRKAAGDLDFIVVIQHHPLYGNMQTVLGGQLLERNYNPPLIAWQERLFLQHDVDLLIAGHNHHYERSLPMRFGRPLDTHPSSYDDPDGFIQVTTGGGGAGLYDFKPESEFAAWSAAHARRFHVVRFDLAPGKLDATAIATDDGAILDRWTLRS